MKARWRKGMIGQKDTDGVSKHCAVMESSSDGAKAREFEEQFVRADEV